MSLSWERRGQVEPLAALAAVAALGLVLALYAGVLETTTPTPEPEVEDAALLRTVGALRTGAILDPEAVGRAAAAAPRGYRLRVTVRAANRTWSGGPEPPGDTVSAARVAPVRISRGTAVSGRVRVEVWPWPEG